MNRTAAAWVRTGLSAVLTAVAALVSLMAWQALSTDFGEVTGPLVLLAVLVAVLGAICRGAGLPSYVVVGAQVAAVVGVLCHSATGAPWPTPDAYDVWLSSVRDAADAARTYAAPVPADVASVHPLLLAGGAAVILGMDLCAGTFRRPAVSGLVLLTVHALPMMITGTAISAPLFVVAGAAYLGMLYLHQDVGALAWGHMVPTHTGRGPGGATGRRSATAVALGIVALALALAVPPLLPRTGVALLDTRGGGSGDEDVLVVNPMADLRRDLTRGQDLRLLRVTTAGDRPSYLRLSVLTTFEDGRWTPGDRDIPVDQVATGELPALDGVSASLDRETHDYDVRVWPDFRSTWLPTTAHVTEIEAGEEWRYDVDTRDFIAVDEDTDTSGMDYRFTGVTLAYDTNAMDIAGSGAREVPSVYTRVPDSIDAEIRDLAASVTEDAPSRFQKAQALQRWFRHTGGFRYDLSPAASLGSGTADLKAFLDEETGRVGYCEQFAASMAIMARTLGIPARVSVGFLEPTEVAPDTWDFTAWDMHAWPELYFPGSGWVRFEPTPSARAGQAPGYSTEEIRPVPTPTLPSPTTNPQPSDQPSATPEPTPTETASEETERSLPWGWVVGALLLAALLIGLVLAPRMLRRRLRDRRLHRGVEGVWDELRAVLFDLGHAWPEGVSPRRTGAAISQLLARSTRPGERPDRPRRGPEEAPEAAEALDRIVSHVEHHRYARETVPPGRTVLEADLVAVEESLRGGVTARTERQGTWWPRSLVDDALGRGRVPAGEAVAVSSRARGDDASAPPSAP